VELQPFLPIVRDTSWPIGRACGVLHGRRMVATAVVQSIVARHALKTVWRAEDELGSAWERFYEAHPLSRSVYPMWSVERGWKPHHLVLYRGDEIAGGLQLGIRRIPYLPFSLSRIDYLLFDDATALVDLSALLAAVERRCRTSFIVETELHLRLPSSAALSRVLPDFGYAPLAHRDATYMIRVDRDDPSLLASFGQQPRNRIRQSLRKGSRVLRTTDPAYLPAFYDAHAATSALKDFVLLPRPLVVRGMRSLLESGRAELFLEVYGDKVANMVLVDMLGLPCAMLAARTRDNIEGRVDSCAQHVHFEAMRSARDRGAKLYDMGGTPGPTPIESHPNYGVWRMKHAFHGEYVELMPYHRRIRGTLTHEILSRIHEYRRDYLEVEPSPMPKH
jgi:GNAT acetyltransferase-like protein